MQPKSEKTWYVSKQDADKLGEFQTKGTGNKRLIEFPDGRLGIMYETGKDAGKVEARTVITPESSPKEGMIPVESFEGGKKVHFGNKISKLEKAKEAKLEEEGREFRDRFMQKETGNEVRDLEAKRTESLKKFNEKKNVKPEKVKSSKIDAKIIAHEFAKRIQVPRFLYPKKGMILL